MAGVEMGRGERVRLHVKSKRPSLDLRLWPLVRLVSQLQPPLVLKAGWSRRRHSRRCVSPLTLCSLAKVSSYRYGGYFRIWNR